MRVVIAGGGPGGAYLAALIRERIDGSSVSLYERNADGATYGFGVVFSEPTMQKLRANDEAGYDALFASAARWPGIDVDVQGDRWRIDGNGFAALERRVLIYELQERARRAGAELHFEHPISPDSPELHGADLVIAADGANSLWRAASPQLGATVDTASAKFIWFGSTTVFPGMTFLFRRNEHGWFAVHGYPYSTERSTFVVETDEQTWRRAGLDQFDVTQAPGPSDERSAAYLSRLFATELGDGELIGNNSRWANFRTVRTPSWRVDDRTVLLGDAAHTAHFSVGSGTKMALEDALGLATELAAAAAGAQTLPEALARYEDVRKADVRRIQDLAAPSLSWWEHFGEYADMPAAQFVFHFMTRSGRIGRSRLQAGDPAFVTRALTVLHGRVPGPMLGEGVQIGGRSYAGSVAQLGGEAKAAHPRAAFMVPDLASSGPGLVLLPETATSPAIAWCVAPRDSSEVDDTVDAVLVGAPEDAIVIIDALDVDPQNVAARSAAEVAQRRVAEVLRFRHDRRVGIVWRSETDGDVAAAHILAGRTDVFVVPVDHLDALLDSELGIAREATR